MDYFTAPLQVSLTFPALAWATIKDNSTLLRQLEQAALAFLANNTDVALGSMSSATARAVEGGGTVRNAGSTIH